MDNLLEELHLIFRDVLDQPNLIITRIERLNSRRLGLPGGQPILDLFPIEHDAPCSADDGFTGEPTPCFRHPDTA